MSSPLAIAGVTAVLKDLLDNGLVDHVAGVLGTGFSVSALAPDAIKLEDNAAPRLNLFMHLATPNPAWRNVGLPSLDAAGRGRLANAPLALDLHYLLTAYGSSDLQAEVLLGYAMQLLHEMPALPRDAIRAALNPPAPPVTGDLLPPVYKALRASDLADQVELIKITPSVMNTEEMSKLWTALQAHYRPTAAYQVSVVLIEGTQPARAPLPVLKRGPVDPSTGRERGVIALASATSPFSEITGLTLPASRIAAQLGDAMTFTGLNLAGTAHALRLSNPSLDVDRTLSPADANDPTSATFTLPNLPADLPAGMYGASITLVRTDDTQARSTNEFPMAIAPQLLSVVDDTVHVDAAGAATIGITCTPALRAEQRVSLIVENTELLADPFTGSTTTPTFSYPQAPLGGPYWLRLRVDGVDSALVDRTQKPPVFTGLRLSIAS